MFWVNFKCSSSNKIKRNRISYTTCARFNFLVFNRAKLNEFQTSTQQFPMSVGRWNLSGFGCIVVISPSLLQKGQDSTSLIISLS